MNKIVPANTVVSIRTRPVGQRFGVLAEVYVVEQFTRGVDGNTGREYVMPGDVLHTTETLSVGATAEATDRAAATARSNGWRVRW